MRILPVNSTSNFSDRHLSQIASHKLRRSGFSSDRYA